MMSTPPPSKKRRCLLTTQPDDYVFKWEVSDFPSFPTTNEARISSPSFFAGGDDVEWQLALYPQSDAADKIVSLFLCLKSTGSTPLPIAIRCTASIAVLNEVFIERKFVHEFQKLESHGWPALVGRDILLNACEAHNSFVILCKLESLLKIRTNITGSTPAPLALNNHRLNDDCCKLFETPNQLVDVHIIVGIERYPAHKILLAARSSVFAAMFQHMAMEENLSNEINIPDFEPPVIHGMLEFIYTDNVKALADLAFDLIAAAEKYDLKYLKAMCEQHLKTILNADNAVTIFVLADRHDCPALLKCVREYVGDHPSDIIETKAYKEMNDVELLKKLVDFMILK